MFSSWTPLSKNRAPQTSSPAPSPRTALLSSAIAARRRAVQGYRLPATDFDHALSPGPDSKQDEDRPRGVAAQEQQWGGDDLPDDELDDLLDDGMDEDGEDDVTPLLPIFSAAHLDSLPVYHLTHTIRLLVASRVETILTWDQLRSPQVSQFLVKPIHEQIRTSHFSRATLYAFMANCLQFNKEVHTNPGNSGTSKTRALVCELLAIKLLKEFSMRELIDALSYDFFPLQGLAVGVENLASTQTWELPHKAKPHPRVTRISTLEVAIRAQSKRFLAHPLVVKQLEAIWAGNIVFHSAADHIHRPMERMRPSQHQGYGATRDGRPVRQARQHPLPSAEPGDHQSLVALGVRRAATLYDPKDASVFKLSRLRVPRYRQFLSTLSFAILLGLYLAVLIQRSLSITLLEIVFWFWSAGFMLDEVVGFNEQGFSLYIMSFWNMFDVGILLLLVCYYGLRLYGILIPDSTKTSVADMAYDVLATNAVLLFPRLFSVLDHSRYFSQLLIAFRMMAMDLVAVFILIVISCSGFFVAFTLSFGSDDYDAGGVAYALFQMLLGYTPAGWARWDHYNLLGRAILTLFLFICQFLIVTILISVLTNSFMAIVRNADEEHQFVFAVNTISMVKSDALFSYVAPANVIAWILVPLKFVLPLRQFVQVNRTVIKVTHFPVLLIIYAYEKTILQGTAFGPTDLIEQRGRPGAEREAFQARTGKLSLFSPKQNRLREPSVATFRKDRALDEVFRRPFRDDTIRDARKSRNRRTTSNVVNNWMHDMGPDGKASPPIEQDRSIVDRLEARRVARRDSNLRLRSWRAGGRRDYTAATMSVVSDPEDNRIQGSSRRFITRRHDGDLPPMGMDDLPEQTDADGDDELVTNDEDENITLDRQPVMTPEFTHQHVRSQITSYFPPVPSSDSPTPRMSTSLASSHGKKKSPAKPNEKANEKPNDSPKVATFLGRGHKRNFSTNTVLHDPLPRNQDSSSSSPSRKAITARHSARNSGAKTPASAGNRTPKRALEGLGRIRPIMPPRTGFQSTPNLEGMLMLNADQARETNFAMELGSDIGDNKAVGGGFVGAVPSSFATQMAFATGALRAGQAAVASGNEDQRMMGRLMLSRMNTLEENFRDMLHEVKSWRKEDLRSVADDGIDIKSGGGGGGRGKPKKSKGKMKLKTPDEEKDKVGHEDVPPQGERGSSI